jgi:hypothetical protein
MKKIVRLAIRKALLTQKSIFYPNSKEINDMATHYNCTESQVYDLHRELKNEGKIVYNEAPYQWKKDDLEYYVGENPKHYFMPLMHWGSYFIYKGVGMLLKGVWYFGGGFIRLCFFCIGWVLKLSIKMAAWLFTISQSIFRYFTESTKGRGELRQTHQNPPA